jgi:hypothetical protein
LKGFGPTAELALNGEGVVPVLKANIAEGDRLTSLLAIAYPQQHGIALKVLPAVSRDDCHVNSGCG